MSNDCEDDFRGCFRGESGLLIGSDHEGYLGLGLLCLVPIHL